MGKRAPYLDPFVSSACSLNPRPILIVGERGSGRDSAAQGLHRASNRREFRKISCDLDHEALRRAIFGYRDQLLAEIAWEEEESYVTGLIDICANGTLYLDRLELAQSGSLSLIQDLVYARPRIPSGGSMGQQPDNVLIIASCLKHPFSSSADEFLHPNLRPAFAGRIVFLPSAIERQDFNEVIAEMAVGIAQALGTTPPPMDENVLRELKRHTWPNNFWDLGRVVRFLVEEHPDGQKVSPLNVGAALEEAQKHRPSEPREYGRRKRCEAVARGLRFKGQELAGATVYEWIYQFARWRSTSHIDPRDIAEHILHAVRNRFYYGEERIRSLVARLAAEMISDATRLLARSRRPEVTVDHSALVRKIRPRIIVSNPFGPLTSAEALHYPLREALELGSGNAVEFSDLPKRIAKETLGLAIICIDDCVGTGQQATEEVVGRIAADQTLAGALRAKASEGVPIVFYLLICVGFADGIRSILASVPDCLQLRILCPEVLGSESRAFDDCSLVFPDPLMRSEARHLVIDRIGRKLYPEFPSGFGGLEALIVFQHNTPNASLPILWKNGTVDGTAWKPLFPRA